MMLLRLFNEEGYSGGNKVKLMIWKKLKISTRRGNDITATGRGGP
jgi:hypothetical protein